MTLLRLRKTFLVLAVCGAAAQSATAASRDFLELALSPDGHMLASVEGDAPDSGGQPVVRELLIRSTDGKTRSAVTLPCGGTPQCWPAALNWSPDGHSLNFVLRKPGSHARSVYRVDAVGGTPQLLLSFDGTIRSLHTLPSGALVMLATAGATKELGAVEAGAPITGELDTDPPIQRLALLEPGAQALRWISKPGLFVYEYEPLPDGSAMVGTAAMGDGDANWWVAKLYRFGADASPEKVIYTPQSAGEQIADPRVSPDGKQVAFVAGLMSDFGSTGGDLKVLDLGSGLARNLTPGAPYTVTAPHWGCDGHLLARALAGANEESLDFGSASGAAPRVLDSAQDWRLRATAATQCGAVLEASVKESFQHGPEIELNDGHGWHAFTHANADVSVAFSAHSVSWHSDKFTVQGWLLMPTNTGSAKLAMVVDVHGGPAAAHRTYFVGDGLFKDLLQHGYAVFMPNPRGSFGQGEAFTRANVKDFGGGDLRDILAGVDAVVKNYPVDPQRLGITGHSYGGFMTMWAVTQTTRFKAAVAGAGLANWQSYYGQNGISEWMIPYFGVSVYDDPAVYAKSSPINFIKQVRTPTLSYVGEDDIECPAAQTLEFGRALQTLGVPSVTVIYPGEGHAFRNPATDADLHQRELKWFERYLK